MRLRSADLQRLSQRLDEALELSEPEREAWLGRLPAGEAALAPTLRKLLANRPATRPPV